MRVHTGLNQFTPGSDFGIRVGLRGMLADRLEEEALLQRSPAFAATPPDASHDLPRPAHRRDEVMPDAVAGAALGAHRLWGCALWDDGVTRLDEAEERMLALLCQRARLRDGQAILDLGCGWGALALWMAKHYPNSPIVAVAAHSVEQRYLVARAPANLEVVRADPREFTTDRRFDRVVCLEQLALVGNWPAMLARIGGWLHSEGKLFVQVACHREYTYPTDDEGGEDGMVPALHPGLIMPSWELLPGLRDHLRVEASWQVSGTHYQRTAEAWLKRLDARQTHVAAVLENADGPEEITKRIQDWRFVFLARAELFGYRDGTEWFVGQYRMIR